MPVRMVLTTRAINAAPGAVWATVGQFASNWHPAIHKCTREIGPGGREGRRFIGADGDAYRERLTYQSHADRIFRYTLIEGIDGVDSYRGEVRVTAEGEGTCIAWRAIIEADEDRLDEIAEGTFDIFQLGFEWLETARLHEPKRKPSQLASPTSLTRRSCDAGPHLSWLSGGAEEGDTIVLFLHGIGGNAQNWVPQLDAFAGSCRVAALDLRGYGESALGAARTTVEDQCNDILRVIHAEGAAQAVLVGLSMGAWIATSFALRQPDAIAGLVLAGGCTGMSEAPPDERAAFLAAREGPLAKGQTPADFASDVVRIIAGPNAGEEALAALQASMAAIPVETYRDALACFCNPPGAFDFARIRCPVLMMTGEHDALAPPSEIRGVSQRIHEAMADPDVRFEVVEGAGHVCNVEEPAAFNRDLGRFLRRVVS